MGKQNTHLMVENEQKITKIIYNKKSILKCRIQKLQFMNTSFSFFLILYGEECFSTLYCLYKLEE